jgi:aryl-alcohol dehydrogenase-like predicted oxidoreductase
MADPVEVPEPVQLADMPEPDDAAPAETMEPSEPAVPDTPATMGRSAYDLVELGNTGIVTSRLAMGSGTNGTGGSSVQTRMGTAFSQLLIDGYDRGIRFFETADAYGSHRLVGDAMRQVGRQNVTLLSKTMAETREEAEADLERFMEELGTDYIDILLLHIRTSPNWTTESEGAMEVLSEAKARGQIRAHGVSCHSLAALELAARTDWVDVDLARINPYRLHMDSDPDTVEGILDQMKAGGKGVLGMKILGQGDAVDRFDDAVAHAARLDCIHGFTIGFRALDELDQVANRIASV